MKYLVLKGVTLTDEIIEKLKEDFNLSEENILNIKFWNSPNYLCTGTIINTNEGATHKCYPYDRDLGGFMKEHSDGVEWKEKKE